MEIQPSKKVKSCAKGFMEFLIPDPGSQKNLSLIQPLADR
jgi:hypothetical protein